MKTAVRCVDFILKWTIILLMGFSVFNVLWQVFTRFALNNPSSWTEEAARYLLIWVSLLAAVYAVRLNMHLAIDVLTERFTGSLQTVSRIVIQVCIFLFALLVMAIGGMSLVNLTLTMSQTSPALNMKLGYVYSVLPISGCLIMFYTVVSLVDTFRNARSK